MGTAVRFKKASVDRQQGEQARFKVIQGPDYGAVYVILGVKATIGRGEENDLVISDLKASRVHAEVSLTPTGWNIKDKSSANGILHNGKVTRDARLRLNDTVTLGETTLEFTTSDIATQMLVAPPRSMSQIQEDQKKLDQHRREIGAGQSPNGGTGAAQSPRLMMWVIGAVVVIFYALAGDDKPKAKKRDPKDLEVKDLSVYLPNVEITKTADTLFKDGFREFQQGNYRRAQLQFETVLQISPGHALATLYLTNCNKAVENEVKVHLDHGKKSLKAGKLREARAHYERILRLLYKDQSNPAFIEAREQLEVIRKELRGEVKDG